MGCDDLANFNVNDLNNYNLNVNIVEPITDIEPIRFRRYTLSYSDDTQNLYLTIALYFDMLGLGVTSMDKVYGQWAWVIGDTYDLNLFIFIGNYPYDIARRRYETFRKLLPLSITAIVNGDRKFLEYNQNLMDSNIIVRFISSHAEFNRAISYNSVEDFLI